MNSRILPVPENRVAWLAVERLVSAFAGGGRDGGLNPLVLHGPVGCGKTLLVNKLMDDVTRAMPRVVISALPAAEWSLLGKEARTEEGGSGPDGSPLESICQSDVLVVEDLQYLSPRAVGLLASAVDDLLGRESPLIVTMNIGPGRLDLPARLVDRLTSGLVVALEPLQAPSRLQILNDCAQRRQLAVTRDVLHWLATHLTGGGRQLDSAVVRLVSLARTRSRPLDVATVARHFQVEGAVQRLSIDRIVREVGGLFKVPIRQLQSDRRNRSIVWPRQVGMYLARKCTKLSLDEIGAGFGGRDHSTVLHACRKVEEVLARDEVLGGQVRRLQASWM